MVRQRILIPSLGGSNPSAPAIPTCTQKHCFGYTFPRYVPKSTVSGTHYGAFVRKDALTLEISGGFIPWDPEYGKTLEYPFFAIGEIVPCWVQSVEPGDKSCTLKLVNYDSRIFD